MLDEEPMYDSPGNDHDDRYSCTASTQKKNENETNESSSTISIFRINV